MDETITVFIGGHSYEIAPECSAADLKERLGCEHGDVHVHCSESDREYVLPNDTVLSEYVEDGAQLAILAAPW